MRSLAKRQETLFEDGTGHAQAQLIDEKADQLPKAVLGFWPAKPVITTISPSMTNRTRPIAKLHHLRQQGIKPDKTSQAKSLATTSRPAGSGKRDLTWRLYLQRPDIGAEKLAKDYERKEDGLQTRSCSRPWPIACRGACAEWLPPRSCAPGYWLNVGDEEGWKTNDLIREKIPGHPPCPGLPGLPDHTENGKLCSACSTRRKIGGVTLTESFAMFPDCGRQRAGIFRTPESALFRWGKITKKIQVEYPINERKVRN